MLSNHILNKWVFIVASIDMTQQWIHVATMTPATSMHTYFLAYANAISNFTAS